MKIFRILLLLILAYLAFIVFTFPATYATTRLNAAKPEVQINDVEGSIWSGGAGEISYKGITIGALDWNAQPLGIIQGEWKNHLRLNGIADAEGELAVTLNGDVNLYKTKLNTTVSQLNEKLTRYIPAQMQQLDGELSADIVKLAVEPKSRQLTWLEGEFTLNKLQMSNGLYLGDYTAEVTTVGKQKFRTELQSTSDKGLQLKGFVIATPQGEIELDLRVANIDMLGKQAASMIQRFMKKTDDGYYRFKWQGNVKYLMMLLG